MRAGDEKVHSQFARPVQDYDPGIAREHCRGRTQTARCQPLYRAPNQILRAPRDFFDHI